MQQQQLVIGDTHGSFFNIIKTLASMGVINEQSSEYQAFFQFYQQILAPKLSSTYMSRSINQDHFNHLLQLIKGLNINTDKNVILLGDMLFDRGEHDLLTMAVLQGLIEKGLPIRIQISNHDAFFLKLYRLQQLDPTNHWDTPAMQTMNPPLSWITRDCALFYNSFLVLFPALKSNPQVRSIVDNFIENFYKPHLFLISYEDIIDRSSGQRQLHLYSHAPLSTQILVDLICKYVPEYIAKLASPQADASAIKTELRAKLNDHDFLKQMIDLINTNSANDLRDNPRGEDNDCLRAVHHRRLSKPRYAQLQAYNHSSEATTLPTGVVSVHGHDADRTALVYARVSDRYINLNAEPQDVTHLHSYCASRIFTVASQAPPAIPNSPNSPSTPSRLLAATPTADQDPAPDSTDVAAEPQPQPAAAMQ